MPAVAQLRTQAYEHVSRVYYYHTQNTGVTVLLSTFD